MSEDEDKSNLPERPTDSGGTSNPIKTWGQEITARAKVRRVKIENELGAEMVRYHDLQVELSDAQARVVEAQARNGDLETIKQRAKNGALAQLNESEITLQEQDIRLQNLDHELSQIQKAQETKEAKEEAEKAKAEAETMNAEADKLDAKIRLAKKQAEFDRIMHDREGVLAELRKDRENIRQAKAAKEQELADLDNPVIDSEMDDESWNLKAAVLRRDIAIYEGQLAVLDQRIEELS